MALLLVAIEIVHGLRVLGPAWQGGDLLYHAALAHAVMHGEIPPGGAYAGLPAYYPPGFHVMLAAVMSGLGLDAVRADQLLTLVWLPVLPLGMFILVRRLTGRPWVALLAALLTAFGGAYDIKAGRIWVNSLFMVGQEAYPLYPRDVVFALLPFGILAFLRGLSATRTAAALGWALVAGLLFGAAAVVQVQLLLPIPAALATVVIVSAIRRPALRLRALGVLVVTGLVGLVLVAPWFLGQLESIRRNGGVALDSAETLLPARFGPWSYPREFGLLLPLGLIGAGVAVLFLRRPDGPRPGGRDAGSWRPVVAEEGLVLVTWFGLAFLLGVLYQPDWPLEDALRPQRMWLIASQPMAGLAAIGLVALAEDLIGRVRPVRIAPRRAIALVVVAATLAACVPTTVATARLLAGTWTEATYAALDLRSDRVPPFRDLLPVSGPRRTTLTYEDWSSLAWYETGATVVGLVPAGFAKLAYDPAVFTGHGQAERRADLLLAFDGDPADLATVAADYAASYVVLARQDDGVGLFDAAAVAVAADPGTVSGGADVVIGNGWDALAMAAGTSLALPLRASGPVHLAIRVAGDQAGPAAPVRRLRLRVLPATGPERHTEIEAPATATEPWQIVRADLALAVGDRLVLEAQDPVTVQSIRGYLPGDAFSAGSQPIPGWRVSAMTADATVLEPAP
jgi:hypothetical protein